MSQFVKQPNKISKKYVKLKLKNYQNKSKQIDIHGYLLGMLMGLRAKMDKKYHGLIVVTGNMGDGKSSLAEGLMGFYNLISGVETQTSDIQWTQERINDLMDSRDNLNRAIWWDELIQAGGNKGKMTKGGSKFKMKFVTNRWKKNLYIVCIDSLENCPDYIVNYCDVWIQCEAPGWERGYFKVNTKKNSIKYAYDMFHKFKKSWSSPELADNKLNWSCKGKTDDFGGFFIDPKKYEEHKSRETGAMDEDDKVNQFIPTPQMIKAYGLKLYNGMPNTKIALEVGCSRNTIPNWIDKMEEYMRTDA